MRGVTAPVYTPDNRSARRGGRGGAMLGTSDWRRIVRVGVGCLLVLSVSTWQMKWSGYVPNPELVGSRLWAALSWSWPLWLLLPTWRRPPRGREVVLAVMASLTVGCGIFAPFSGRPYALQRIQLLPVAGHSVQLALMRSRGWMLECDDLVVVLSGGWSLQKLGARACSGHDRSESLDPKGFEVEPGPTAASFELFGLRTGGDRGTQRFRLGVYRVGLGGRLVRVAGGDEAD